MTTCSLCGEAGLHHGPSECIAALKARVQRLIAYREEAVRETRAFFEGERDQAIRAMTQLQLGQVARAEGAERAALVYREAWQSEMAFGAHERCCVRCQSNMPCVMWNRLLEQAVKARAEAELLVVPSGEERREKAA